MEVLQLFNAYTINTSLYSKRLDKSSAWIRNWPFNGTTPENVDRVLGELTRTARRLKSANLSKLNLFELLDETGLALTTVARYAGMSRQAVYKAYSAGLNKQQKERLESAVQSIGAELISEAQRLKKAA